MSNVLIVLIIFVLFPAVVLGFILVSRYLKYRETLTMLEHGITPPPAAPPVMMPRRPPVVVVNQGQGGAGRGTLIWGLVLSGVGLALTLALWPIGFIANSASGNSVNFPLGLGPWMLVGFTPLFIGLALILGFVIMRPERGPNPPTPFPTGEGGDVGAYPAHAAQRAPAPGTPSGQAPYVPTEAIVQQEVTEVVPPGSPIP